MIVRQMAIDEDDFVMGRASISEIFDPRKTVEDRQSTSQEFEHSFHSFKLHDRMKSTRNNLFDVNESSSVDTQVRESTAWKNANDLQQLSLVEDQTDVTTKSVSNIDVRTWLYSNLSWELMRNFFITTDDEAKRVDIPNESNNNNNTLKNNNYRRAKIVDVWMMGLTIVLGWQIYGWNEGLHSGFGTWMTAQSLMGLAFIIFMLCLSEIASAISFTGGSYGLARVVLGFYPGYLVGCLQILQYIIMSSISVTFIGTTLISSDYLSWDPRFLPLIWLLIFVCLILVIAPGVRMMLTCNMILGGFSLLLVIIYCLGSFRFVSFSHYASRYDYPMSSDTEGSPPQEAASAPQWFIGGFTGFLQVLPFTAWGYAGVESLILVTSIAKEPKRVVPLGATASVLTICLSNISISFIACSLPPGLYAAFHSKYILTIGLTRIFECSSAAASFLILPTQLAMAWAYIIPFGKLLHSMAQSKLIPEIFGLSKNKTLLKSLVVGCCFAYMFCLLGFLLPAFGKALHNVAILSAFLSYLAQLMIFSVLRTKFSSIKRQFRNPFGLPSVFFVSLFFSLGAISTAYFQKDGFIVLTTIIVFISIISIYYVIFAKRVQSLSKDEQRTVFKLHVINFNIRNQKLLRKGVDRSKADPWNKLIAHKIGIKSTSTLFTIPSSAAANYKRVSISSWRQKLVGERSEGRIGSSSSTFSNFRSSYILSSVHSNKKNSLRKNSVTVPIAADSRKVTLPPSPTTKYIYCSNE